VQYEQLFTLAATENVFDPMSNRLRHGNSSGDLAHSLAEKR
jgi:hypothetical protein